MIASNWALINRFISNMSSSKLDQLFKYLETNPNDSFARFCIAQEYKKAGDHENALSYFQQLRENDPNYLGTYYHLGKLYEEMGDEEHASAIYQEGMEVARKKGDQHSLNELHQAYQILTGGEDEFEEEP